MRSRRQQEPRASLPRNLACGVGWPGGTKRRRQSVWRICRFVVSLGGIRCTAATPKPICPSLRDARERCRTRVCRSVLGSLLQACRWDTHGVPARWASLSATRRIPHRRGRGGDNSRDERRDAAGMTRSYCVVCSCLFRRTSTLCRWCSLL